MRELEGYTGVSEYINEHRLPISKWSNGFSTSYVSLQAGNATQMLQVSCFMTSSMVCYCQTSESRRSPFHVGLNENKTWCAIIYIYNNNNTTNNNSNNNTYILFSRVYGVFWFPFLFGRMIPLNPHMSSEYTTNQVLSLNLCGEDERWRMWQSREFHFVLVSLCFPSMVWWCLMAW